MSRSRRLFLHELAGLLALAGPIVINQLGQIGMNTADTVMVGPLGAAPLAAAGLGTAIHQLGLTIATGVVLGTGPLVSQAFGAGDLVQCRRVFVQGCWLALLISVPVMLSCLWGEGIALSLGQDPEVARLAGGYLRALVGGIPAALLFVAGRQYLEGMGRAKVPMMITFMGLTINIVANHVFIHGAGPIPAMGVVGSGWATSIVRWCMVVAMSLFLLRHAELHPFRGVRRRIERALLNRAFTIGLPIGIQFGLEVGLFAFAAVMMGWLGPAQLAAHQVTLNIAATTFMVALGTSLAGSIRVGQHIGAGRIGSMRRAVIATYVLSTGFMAICALIFLLLSEQLIALYTPHPDIIVLGGQLLLIAAAFQVFDGAQVAGMAVLRGATDTRIPMVIAAVGYWLAGLGTALWLGFGIGYGPHGIWAGLSLGLAVVAVLLVVRVRRVLWLRPPATLRGAIT